MEQLPEYDVFISYVDADHEWVEGYLLDALTKANLRCHKEAAFALGKPKITEFENAIRQSNRTLLIISHAYLADDFSEFIDLLAQHHNLETGTWRVIPLILEPVTLPLRLNSLVKLDATNTQKQEEAIKRLCQELERPVPASSSKPPCPYPGMISFSEDESHLFFGRDLLIEQFIQSLRGHHFLAVIGASGSGKSSLIFAGLIPGLQKSGLFGKGEWLVRTMRPGGTPLKNLADALKTENIDLAELDKIVHQILSTQPKAERLLLVIDQLEELFTLNTQEAIFFQEILLRLVKIPKCFVITAIRADFYGELMASQLWQIVEKNLENVKPLDTEGLRQAITKPCENEKVRVFIDKSLVERLVSEAAGEPGILPFIQETLVLLWEKLERRFLPLKAYEELAFTDKESGNTQAKGLQAAIAFHAEATFKQLSEPQQAIARRIFLRLVQFGEGRPDTRRQQSVNTLQTKNDNLNLFNETLQHLEKHRLLISDGAKDNNKKVDIAHEALISGWPTLKEWINKRRQAEQERRWLEEKATEWVRLGRARGGLLDADELKEANDWLLRIYAADLGCSDDLEDLIEKSNLAIEKSKREEEENKRRLRKRATIAIIFAAGAGIASFIAFNQWQSAEAREKTNKSLQLATSSEANFNIDTTRSLLLTIQANIIQETPQATYALWQAFQENHEQLQLVHNGKVLYTEFDPNNSQRVLTVSDDQTAKIWDLNTPSNNIILQEHTGSIIYGSFDSRNSNRLLTVSNDGTAKIWDISNVKKPIVISNVKHNNESISYGRISSDNPNQLLTISQRSVKLWDISNSQAPKELKSLSAKKGEVWRTGISDPQNFNRVLILSNNGTALIWDLGHSEQVLTLNHPGVVNGSFDLKNPKRILTVGYDKIVRIWDLDSRNNIVNLSGHKNTVRQGIFDPKDSNRILTVSDDGTARIWDIKQRKEIKTLTVQGQVLYGAFNPQNSNEALTVSSDDIVKIWDIESSKVKFTLSGHTKPINLAVFDSKNPQRILTASEDNTARIWDTSDKSFTTIPNQEGKKSSVILTSIFNSTVSNQILTITKDGNVANWDINQHKKTTLPIKLGILEKAWLDSNNPSRIAIVKRDGSAELRIGESTIPLRPKGIKVESISIDPKNVNRLLTVSSTTATVWDISSNPPIIKQEVQTSPIPMNQGQFDPNNPNRLATVGGDGKVSIWNLQQPNKVEKLLVVSNKELWHVSFDPNNSNRILVVGSDKVVRVWDIEKDIPIAELPGHKDIVVYGSFDPKNSNRILTISHDGTARVWDLTNPEKPLILKGNNQRLVYGSFDTQNSNRVITVSSDGIARIYNIGGKELLSLAWENSSRCLNSQEVAHYSLKQHEPLISLSSYLKKSHKELLNKKQRPDCSN